MIGPEDRNSAGNDSYNEEGTRAGEYGDMGDFGNQAVWGVQGNRRDPTHGPDWHWEWISRLEREEHTE
ncbi:MAG: hypothetical protein C5B51_31690 [Terriglobia bacterium]|nr:MAG: hypothetical protein C5B51_31690 [Terriglobia bacterium]